MQVFVLNRARDFEGESTLGVYATAELAEAAARKHAVSEGYADTEDELKQIDLGSKWAGKCFARSEAESTQYVIWNFELNGERKEA
jgi:hypothetical protein